MANEKTILGGYIASWEINGSTPLTAIPADNLTHLFYAFADVLPDGTVQLDQSNGLDGDISFLQSLKSANPDLKIIVSIGGASDWDFSSAATPENRSNLITSAINFMNANDFDGIDIDWETPTREENQNYLDLLSGLEQALPADKLLTTALLASD